MWLCLKQSISTPLRRLGSRLGFRKRVERGPLSKKVNAGSMLSWICVLNVNFVYEFTKGYRMQKT